MIGEAVHWTGCSLISSRHAASLPVWESRPGYLGAASLCKAFPGLHECVCVCVFFFFVCGSFHHVLHQVTTFQNLIGACEGHYWLWTQQTVLANEISGIKITDTKWAAFFFSEIFSFSPFLFVSFQPRGAAVQNSLCAKTGWRAFQRDGAAIVRRTAQMAPTRTPMFVSLSVKKN